MLSKKYYIKIAKAISMKENENERKLLINFLCPILKEDNSRFNEDTFKSYIEKQCSLIYGGF